MRARCLPGSWSSGGAAYGTFVAFADGAGSRWDLLGR
jgi:hypothetical protein